MTAQQVLSEAVAALAAAGVPSPEFDAKALLAEVLTDGDISALVTRRTEPVPSDAFALFHNTLLRRCNREPLQYILGYTEFYGLRLKCDPRALIPRPDTETLVESVLESVRGAASESRGAAVLRRGASGILGDGDRRPTREPSITRVADIGTGTGAIAIALAHHTPPEVRVWATDCSAEALALARENVASHELEDRITLLQGDGLGALFEAGVAGEIEALVSNPPYVTAVEYAALEPEIVTHEPWQALVGGGEDGVGFYRELTAQAQELPALRLVALEVGAGQAEAVSELVTDALKGFVVGQKNDIQGLERVVLARRSDV